MNFKVSQYYILDIHSGVTLTIPLQRENLGTGLTRRVRYKFQLFVWVVFPTSVRVLRENTRAVQRDPTVYIFTQLLAHAAAYLMTHKLKIMLFHYLPLLSYIDILNSYYFYYLSRDVLGEPSSSQNYSKVKPLCRLHEIKPP